MLVFHYQLLAVLHKRRFSQKRLYFSLNALLSLPFCGQPLNSSGIHFYFWAFFILNFSEISSLIVAWLPRFTSSFFGYRQI